MADRPHISPVLSPLLSAPLRRRSDFLRIQKSPLRWVTPGFVISCEPASPATPAGSISYGFTITKKIGNAVVRNRVRRRLRHLVQAILPTMSSLDGWSLTFLARQDALTRDYAELGRDLRWALRKIQAQSAPAASASTIAPAANNAS